MDKYSGLTAIEILKLINDVEKKHIEKKVNAIKCLKEIEILDETINKLTTTIESLEAEYVELMGALIEKQNE